MTLLAVEWKRSLRGSCEAGMSRWAVQGHDAGSGLLRQRLGFSGRPRSALLRRLTVQRRRLDVVSRTSFEGLFDGSSLIERTGSEVQRRFYHSRLPAGRTHSVSAPRCTAAPDWSGIETASWTSVAK
jgi:hypothetical protein